jgi:hypothetical protein
MSLWCCWKDLKEQDFMDYILKDLDLRWGEILNFKRFLSLIIQINHKNPSFGMKNKLRIWWSHFEGLQFNSSMKNWDVLLVLLERS